MFLLYFARNIFGNTGFLPLTFSGFFPDPPALPSASTHPQHPPSQDACRCSAPLQCPNAHQGLKRLLDSCPTAPYCCSKYDGKCKALTSGIYRIVMCLLTIHEQLHPDCHFHPFTIQIRKNIPISAPMATTAPIRELIV